MLLWSNFWMFDELPHLSFDQIWSREMFLRCYSFWLQIFLTIEPLQQKQRPLKKNTIKLAPKHQNTFTIELYSIFFLARCSIWTFWNYSFDYNTVELVQKTALKFWKIALKFWKTTTIVKLLRFLVCASRILLLYFTLKLVPH